MFSLRYVVVSMALVSLLSACATSGRSGVQADPSPTGSFATANGAWAAFPVDQVPRPIVLISGAVNAPMSGFGIGDDKEAYFAGNFQLAIQLPTTTTTADGSAVISASKAYVLLQGQRLAGITATSALQVTSVQLGQASFGTDRGQRSLPAWLFSFAGVADPAQVLAIPTAETWQHPQTGSDPLGIDSATVSGNGTNLKVGFSGSSPGTGSCEAEYSAEVTETQTTVTVAIHEIPHAPSTGPNLTTPLDTGVTMANCADVAYLRTVTITLHQPLGNRVLLNDQGSPVPAI